jgi:hypothetical protein
MDIDMEISDAIDIVVMASVVKGVLISSLGTLNSSPGVLILPSFIAGTSNSGKLISSSVGAWFDSDSILD